jgi:hypothetical protein
MIQAFWDSVCGKVYNNMIKAFWDSMCGKVYNNMMLLFTFSYKRKEGNVGGLKISLCPD